VHSTIAAPDHLPGDGPLPAGVSADAGKQMIAQLQRLALQELTPAELEARHIAMVKAWYACDEATARAYLDAGPKPGEQLSLSETVKRSLAQRKIVGLPLGRPCLPLTAANLRAAELRAEGQSWKQTAAALTAEGFTPPKGETWTIPQARHAWNRAVKAQAQT
jgi:hypothetical protein